jgi:hypothetical protein
MQIQVIEAIAGDRFEDQRQGGVSGEAHRADAPFRLPAPCHLQASARPQGLLEMLRQVDAMDGQQIESLHPQPLQAQPQLRLKGLAIRLRRHLALHDALRIG